MAQAQTIEGTREEVQARLQSFPKEQRFRLTPLPPEPKEKTFRVGASNKNTVQEEQPQTPRQLTGMGKFAGILPSSEEFMRHKQEDIDLEDRNLPR